ncbi:MAG: rhodanese-like domain-containing protein [Proteobacteria bacterium]|nr:rhodanese-like domain-containing protein [Pseudomonadota bacterium]MBU1688492.1 rhodanese-like domain-containing protein [Pseudomonadota bacterium]
MQRFQVFVLAICALVIVAACSSDRKPEVQAQKNSAATTSNPSLITTPFAANVPPVEKQSVFRTVSPQEAETLIKSRKDLLLIDVRSPEELKEGFIAGSKLVPFMDIARGQQTLPDQPILLICAVGGRSFGVGQFYATKGYQEVYNLKGGIAAWKKAGLPLQYK